MQAFRVNRIQIFNLLYYDMLENYQRFSNLKFKIKIDLIDVQFSVIYRGLYPTLMTPCTSKGYRGPTLTQTILPQTVSVQWVFIFFFGIFSECRDMLFTKKNTYIKSTIKVFIYKETAINISAFSVNTIWCDFLFNSLSKCYTKQGFILCDQGDIVQQSVPQTTFYRQ